jgi:hypothetical protein
VFRFPALRRHEAHKTESQALTKTNDGELSILDAMENLVKAGGGPPHPPHPSAPSAPSAMVCGVTTSGPRSEFLTHSAAQGTVAQSARKSLTSLWAALYACLLIPSGWRGCGSPLRTSQVH